MPDLRLKIEQLLGERHFRISVKTATIILADKKKTGSFAILDWLEGLFSCRK